MKSMLSNGVKVGNNIYHCFFTSTVSQARLLPLLRSDRGRRGRESIKLTFLSQLRNLAAGVGMKIRPHM